MTTTRKLAYVVAGAAGLLISLQAMAADATADRSAAQQQAARAAKVQPAGSEAAGARPAGERLAHVCSCAARS